MSAPSSVETSTSTDSGDWLNQEGAGLVDQPLPLCRPPSCPPFPHRRPTSPLWASWGDEGWGDRLTRDEQYGITRTQKLLRRVGEGASLFFFFFLLDSLFVFVFFQNKTEPLCLIAPDTDCVRMEVSLCTWVGVCLLLVLFKLFWQLGGREEEDQQRNKDNSTLLFLLLLHHHQTLHLSRQLISLLS